ncbi:MULTISPECIES: hypothetical protein [Photorhabdus]|uniref:hypothetical protein n=1 Tax=Photorhabdus TaxID=29487 RepID=UPI001E5C6D3E|nr:hypothetical protein [Photorhabdus bodei]MCC8465029.1 hypothetical protein [Photorhabdus bodei]
MNIHDFDKNIKPLLRNYSFEYSFFVDGEFGNLERIEFDGCGKLGTIDIWSKGWLSIDIYDCILDRQVMNVIYSPEEKQSCKTGVEVFLRILLNEK